MIFAVVREASSCGEATHWMFENIELSYWEIREEPDGAPDTIWIVCFEWHTDPHWLPRWRGRDTDPL